MGLKRAGLPQRRYSICPDLGKAAVCELRTEIGGSWPFE